MPCHPVFPKQFPLDCLRDLTREFLKGDLSNWRCQSMRAAWSLGCILAYTKTDDDVPDLIALGEESNIDAQSMSDEELAAACEEALHLNGVTGVRSRSIITPELIALIVELLLRFLSKRQGKEGVTPGVEDEVVEDEVVDEDDEDEDDTE